MIVISQSIIMSNNTNERRTRFCVTIDVLTDGSEGTGDNGTLFLSVWKHPPSLASSTASEDSLWLHENWDMELPKARYLISGAGDCFARLCADQRMKVSPTRAIFLPPPSSLVSSPLSTGEGEDGLAALLLALQSSGSSSLHLVSPNQNTCDTMEEYSDIVLGKASTSQRRTLEVVTCHIPSPPKNQDSDEDPAYPSKHSLTSSGLKSNLFTWWKVYEDDFIQVHAGWILSSSCCAYKDDDHNQNMNGKSTNNSCPTTTDNILVYLYTIRNSGSQSDEEPEPKQHKTIALIPAVPRCENVQTNNTVLNLYKKLRNGNLPLVGDDEAIQISINFVITLKHPMMMNVSFSTMPPVGCDGDEENVQFFYTSPKLSTTTNNINDSGILIRSQQVARYFHENLGPTSFPYSGINIASSSHSMGMDHLHNNANRQDRLPTKDSTTARTNAKTTIRKPANVTLQILESCTSIILGKPHHKSYSIIDRRIQLQKRTLSDEWSESLEKLRSFLLPPSTEIPALATKDNNNDENEIDLDELEDDDENEIDLEDDREEVEERSPTTMGIANPKQPQGDSSSCPQLVVLGTGCASPSAIRGASGYAVIFPKQRNNATIIGATPNQHEDDDAASKILVVDAGEGITPMLSRIQIKDWARRILGVWISHAHLDHYGGLPNLVRSIHCKRWGENENGGKGKRKRSSMDAPTKSELWVMAPPKVLKFLDLSLNCRRGKHCNTGAQFFVPRFHQNIISTSPPLGPWTHFVSIPVDHNCCPAYGLLLGWKKRSDNATNNSTASPIDMTSQADVQASRCMMTHEWFCFSGDTRPCRRLVDTIRRYRPNPTEEPLFLLHEATFGDAEQGQATQKKHSTVSEALRVAYDTRAQRVLLTHFSQRYIAMNGSNIDNDDKNVTTTNSHSCVENERPDVHFAFAVDGLWIPLSSGNQR